MRSLYYTAKQGLIHTYTPKPAWSGFTGIPHTNTGIEIDSGVNVLMKITTLQNKSPFNCYPSILKMVDSNLRVERTREIVMCIEKRFVSPSVITDHYPNIIGARYT